MLIDKSGMLYRRHLLRNRFLVDTTFLWWSLFYVKVLEKLAHPVNYLCGYKSDFDLEVILLFLKLTLGL